MSKEWEAFKHILTRSVERNGEKPLTNRWLLNICKMADRYVEHQDSVSQAQFNHWEEQEYMWGSD